MSHDRRIPASQLLRFRRWLCRRLFLEKMHRSSWEISIKCLTATNSKHLICFHFLILLFRHICIVSLPRQVHHSTTPKIIFLQSIIYWGNILHDKTYRESPYNIIFCKSHIHYVISFIFIWFDWHRSISCKLSHIIQIYSFTHGEMNGAS